VLIGISYKRLEEDKTLNDL